MWFGRGAGCEAVVWPRGEILMGLLGVTWRRGFVKFNSVVLIALPCFALGVSGVDRCVYM